MAGVDQRHLCPAQRNGAALVEPDGPDPVAGGQKAHQVVDAGHLDIQFFRDRHRIADMVAVAMGQQDMGGAGDRLGPAVHREHRVAGQPRVDQQHGVFDLDAKAGMAKPGDVHVGIPLDAFDQV